MARAWGKRLFIIGLFLWPISAMAQAGLPVYGNWCGPNHPRNPAVAAAPVDALDAACMRHDYCTAAQGRFDCGCDLTLMNELRTTRWETPYIQSDARGIYDAIALIPCTDPFGTAEKQRLFTQDALTDALNGRPAPLDIMQRWRRLFLQAPLR